MDDSSASATSLLPPPRKRSPLGGLMFSSREEPSPSPSDLPDLSSQPAPSAGASDAPHDAPSAPSAADPSSSPGSTPAPERPQRVKVVDRAGITATAIALVEGAGSGAHQLLAKDEIDTALHRYVVTDQEAVQIGTPLGELAARHSGGVAGIGNPDVHNIIQACIGLAVYGARQLGLAAHARNVRAGRLRDQLQAAPDGPRSPADTAVDV